eukprot:TRINITY_DN9165_c0_g2_i1.p1 TRINITY_DN9165_c0_g2~~TRINITY_DN9165_c0_g2_i1.p1  ORF type:complete len:229 (-),score=50.62 TRINITY_DN9165_c0_g2_i1:92-703(-)
MKGVFTRRSFLLALFAAAAWGQPDEASASAAASKAAAKLQRVRTYVYDPASQVDPFDTAAQAVSEWLKNPDDSSIQRKDDGWRSKFCNCLENGNIASWYQDASSLYILDTCSAGDGLVLRTGHLQQRYEEPLVSAMSCDVLKLMSFCFSHTCPECLDEWSGHCEKAHYTTPACNVDCSGAAGLSVCGGAAFALLAFIVMALVN